LLGTGECRTSQLNLGLSLVNLFAVCCCLPVLVNASQFPRTCYGFLALVELHLYLSFLLIPI
ncbi:hypothetical protein AB6E39_08675, partial [Vibrio splendidus]